jgi:ribonuclease BN (tRNA processing enzyme)
MQLIILGTRGEIEESLPYHSKHSGILVDQELLIDLGEKRFLDYQPHWILLSHLHPDHAYFVRKGSVEAPPSHVPLFGPEERPPIQLLEKTCRLGPYRVTPIPTHHSKHVKSQGYVVQKDRVRFFYTSDLVWINKEYHALIGRVDLVITEASFIRKGGMIQKDPATQLLYGHNGIPNLLHLLQTFSSRILLTHFGSWFYQDTKAARRKIRALAKEYDVEILIGYDGLIFELN